MRVVSHPQGRITFGPIWPVIITTRAVSLSELFWIFLKIGAMSFGGLMALVSMTSTAMVDKKKLLTHDDMLDCMSLASLLPGPQGINCVVYVGYRLRGGLGAWASAAGVLLPSLICLGSLTTLYLTHASQMPALSHLFAGVLPAVAAVIAAVGYRMSKKVLTGRREAGLALLAALCLLAAPPVFRPYVTMAIVLGYALAGWYLFRKPHSAPKHPPPRLPWRLRLGLLAVFGFPLLTCLVPLAIETGGLMRIALTISGMSLMLFGGGYVLIPMIHDIAVSQAHWLTTQAFLDGLALSQVTPGPVLPMAVFIGQHAMANQYGLLYGTMGAIVAMLAIFVPPGVLMIAASNASEDIAKWTGLKAGIRGIRCGILGVVGVAALAVLYASLPAWPDVLALETVSQYMSQSGHALVIFGAAFIVLIKLRIGGTWVVPAAGLIGLLQY